LKATGRSLGVKIAASRCASNEGLERAGYSYAIKASDVEAQCIHVRWGGVGRGMRVAGGRFFPARCNPDDKRIRVL